MHNRATHLNKCYIRNKNKNETLLVNVLNSSVKIFLKTVYIYILQTLMKLVGQAKYPSI